MNNETDLLHAPGVEPIPRGSTSRQRYLPLQDAVCEPTAIGRHIAGKVLGRPGDFTVRLVPERVRAVLGYTISIRNTGREPLLAPRIAELRRSGPPWTEISILDADLSSIPPGGTWEFARLNIRAPEWIHIHVSVVARTPGAGVVYQTCRLELESRPA